MGNCDSPREATVTEDRITDGKRIAQLLASELSGLERGPLDAISVDDADPDATPSEQGTTAYQVSHRGDPVATVLLYPEHATVRLHEGQTWSSGTAVADTPSGAEETTASRASAGGLSVDGSALQIATGAAVKRAVDAVADLVADTDTVADAAADE